MSTCQTPSLTDRTLTLMPSTFPVTARTSGGASLAEHLRGPGLGVRVGRRQGAAHVRSLRRPPFDWSSRQRRPRRASTTLESLWNESEAIELGDAAKDRESLHSRRLRFAALRVASVRAVGT